MEYVKIAETTDLTTGNKKKISLKNKEILLTNVNNVYYAIDSAKVSNHK